MKQDGPPSCATCGLFGWRNADTYEILEVDDSFRDDGTLRRGDVIPMGLCAGQYANLWNEDLERRRNHVTEKEFLHRDRSDCPGYTPWKWGFTPKEHIEMMDRKWAEERADRLTQEMRDRQDRLDKEAREHHEQQMDMLRSHHEQQTEMVRSHHKWDMAILGGLIAVATLLGSMIQASWIPNPWGG